MNFRLIIALTTLLTIPVTALAEPIPIDELCKNVICRDDTKVLLNIDSEEYWEGTFPKSPLAINGELVNIVPGETIYITGIESNDQLSELKASFKKPENKKAIEISLQQEADEKEHKFMLLTINNPHTKPLKYSAGMVPLGEEDVFKTTSCPILPGITNYESWPHPILRILLKDFRFVDKDNKDSMKCT